jgi:hypothetical protein
MSRTEEDIQSGVDIPIQLLIPRSAIPFGPVSQAQDEQTQVENDSFIADCDVIELSNDAGRELMVKVTACVDNARVEVGCLTPSAGPLHASEFVSQLPQRSWILDFPSVGQSSTVVKDQVDANAAAHWPLAVRQLFFCPRRTSSR